MRCQFNKTDCTAYDRINNECKALDDTYFKGKSECPFYTSRFSKYTTQLNADYDIIRTSSGCRRVPKKKL